MFYIECSRVHNNMILFGWLVVNQENSEFTDEKNHEFNTNYYASENVYKLLCIKNPPECNSLSTRTEKNVL